MNNRVISQVDEIISRPDKREMISPLSRIAFIDDCFGIGGVWFASGQEFHASEGFPAKAELTVFLSSGEVLPETQHTQEWHPSYCSHKRVFGRGKLVVRELKFIARDAIFDIIELSNQTDKILDIRLVVTGRASAKGTVSFRDGRIHIDEEEGRTLSGTYTIIASDPRFTSFTLSSEQIEPAFKFEPGPGELYGDRTHYAAFTDIRLPAEGRAKNALALSWDFSKRHALSHLPKNLLSAESLLTELKSGWQDYWNASVPTLSIPDEGMKKLYYYGWYVTRAEQMPPQGRLPHIYVAPTKFAHVGVWLQDSAYIAIGGRWLNNTGLSQNALRLLEKNQFSNGLIPSSVNAGGVRVYNGETGHAVTLDTRQMGKHRPEEIPSQLPPTFTIAADEVFKMTWNLDFLRECYHAALKMDEWMANEREDENGLFKAVHLMDIEHCAGSKRIEGHNHIKAVDVSALNVYHRRLLLKWSEYLHETRKPAGVEERAIKTAESIRNLCWDNERRFFYDLLPDGSKSSIETAAGFYPLFAFGPDLEEERLQALLEALQDRGRFGTTIPIPTVSAASGEYGQGVSQSVDWFLINGLIRHNMNEPAEKITRKLLKAHLPGGLPECREGFDARTGEGKGAPDFAWVGLANDLILNKIMGIQPKPHLIVLEPWLFDSWDEASVSKLKVGPYFLDIGYHSGRINSTIKIRPVQADKAFTPLIVDIVWRTRPGDRVESVETKSEYYYVEDLVSQGRQVVRIEGLLCPLDSETLVNIRTRKA